MKSASAALHYLLRGALSAGFAGYIVYLVREDLLGYYIAPRMEPVVKLSAVALALIATYQLFAALWSMRGEPPSCGCDHAPSKSNIRNTIAYLLFAAPLLLGYFAPDAVMGSNVVDKKGIVLTTGDSSGAPARSASDSGVPAAPGQGGLFYSDDLYARQYSAYAESLYAQNPIVIEDATYLESSTAIDLFMHAFEGKPVRIEGFVYRQDEMTDSQFVVARLAMECCTADATPYGFLVEWPEAAALEEDTWVTVTGTLRVVSYHGVEISSIVAQSVEKMASMPETPYVYPNYDILSSYPATP